MPTHVNIMVLASHLGNRNGVPSQCAFVPPRVDKKQIPTLLGTVLRRKELQETNGPLHTSEFTLASSPSVREDTIAILGLSRSSSLKPCQKAAGRRTRF